MKSNTPDFLIVGAGFGGIGMAIRLIKAGYTSIKILERANAVGGTWRDNTYPGAACDVSSHLYSFSFEPKPDWSRMFSPHYEIKEYIEHCVKKYQLTDLIHYGEEASFYDFNESEGVWNVSTKSGKNFKSKYVINALGPLNRPVLPKFEGIDNFSGPQFHSSEWRHAVNLNGKKVAVIGTGASAIQIVPEVAKVASKLVLFQRTAPWVLPKPDGPMSDKSKRLFTALPFTQRLLRWALYWRNEATVFGVISNPKRSGWIEKLVKSYIKHKVKDPDLQKQLTPNFKIGCKRILLSNNYYPTFNLPNVHLESTAIERIESNGIVLKNSEKIEVDAIIYCTGFDASEFPSSFIAKGLNGVMMSEQWKNGPQAYYGTFVRNFPNQFILVGPNTGLGHNSIIFMMECQYNHIIDCVNKAESRKAKFVVVKEKSELAFNEKIQRELSTTVWQSGGCKSWYQTKDGKNTTLWPTYTFSYWLQTRKINTRHYDFVK